MKFKYDKYLYYGCGDVFFAPPNLEKEKYIGKTLLSSTGGYDFPINKLSIFPENGEGYEIIGDDILNHYIVVACVKKTNKLLEMINKYGVGFSNAPPCCMGKITFAKNKKGEIYPSKKLEKVTEEYIFGG